MMQLEGGFEVMSWEETLYDEAKGQPKFSHVRTTYELKGDIEGEASICYLMAHSDDTAHYLGFVMVTGKIDGREGSFVMRDVGTFENEVSKGRWAIIPHLGAREMREIRGYGHYAAGPTGVSYLLDVSF